MSTHNVPFSIYKRKSAEVIPNLELLDFFQGTRAGQRSTVGRAPDL